MSVKNNNWSKSSGEQGKKGRDIVNSHSGARLFELECFQAARVRLAISGH